MRAHRALGTDVTLLWFACVLVALCGYVFVFRTGEARIEERHADAVLTVAQARAGERTLAEHPRLEAERHRLYAAIRHVDLDVDATQLVARFVRDAARVATQHHVSVVAIVAAGPAPSGNEARSSPVNASASPGSPNATVPAVATVALDCTVEGRYADVLAALRDLSSTRVLASVSLTSLARKNAEAADATVSAAVHVVLERLAPAGLPYARTRSV